MIVFSYYTLIMWFPEIFLRFNKFEDRNLNATTTGVCVTSPDKKIEGMELIFRIFVFELKGCDPSIDNRVFMDTVIIGLSCIPTSVSLSYFMNAIGKKNVLGKQNCNFPNHLHNQHSHCHHQSASMCCLQYLSKKWCTLYVIFWYPGNLIIGACFHRIQILVRYYCYLPELTNSIFDDCSQTERLVYVSHHKQTC